MHSTTTSDAGEKLLAAAQAKSRQAMIRVGDDTHPKNE